MRELLHKSLLGMVLILIPFSVAAASQKVSGSVVLRETQCVSVGVNDAKLTIYRHNADGTTSLANDIYRDAALQVRVTQQGLDFVHSNQFTYWEFFVRDGTNRYDIVFSESTNETPFTRTYQLPLTDGYINVKMPRTLPKVTP